MNPQEPEPFAPGWPGIPPRWTSSAKTGVGTAVTRDSRVWFTLSHGILNMASGKILRIETLARARVLWSADAWRTVHDTDTRDTTLGVHVADLPTESLPSRGRIDFTFWLDRGRWEGRDCLVVVEGRSRGFRTPQLARGDQILAIPTLVRRLPEPVKKIIGDLSNTERVLVGLNIRPVR